MPLGAFIADRKLMWALTENPVLGHITDFRWSPGMLFSWIGSYESFTGRRNDK
jgi:hypothetical protein